MANVMWFRHGLRLHDNPALLEALADQDKDIALIPIFIFDGESAGTKCVCYNRMHFLLESLHDLDTQFSRFGTDYSGRLILCRGDPVTIFRRLNTYVQLRKICVEQDCEPIWNKRDYAVFNFCQEEGIQWVEKVSHTLWDPRVVIETNGGIPPLTYQMFLHTVQILGPPPRPAPNPKWEHVRLFKFSHEMLDNLNAFHKTPRPEDLNVFAEGSYKAKVQWKGGETQALLHLAERLRVEEAAFAQGFYMPNHVRPNILESPKSMSAHLRFGCLSVRRFYWDVHELFRNVQQTISKGYPISDGAHITGQLIWREYFYTMSVNNPKYDRIEGNEICLNIPWSQPEPEQLHRWQVGKTGYPLVDAAMRQLRAEGWLHHTLRNVVATFLTRGGLWISWEHGVQHFLKYLLDADWSVCAGNWMWVSSSAFERLLDSSLVTCPGALAKRLDPDGRYIRQYVPELEHVPTQYIHEPWTMLLHEQKEYNCILGVHYPERIIDLRVASERNAMILNSLRLSLIADGAPDEGPPHCRPSNVEEVRHFFWLPI